MVRSRRFWIALALVLTVLAAWPMSSMGQKAAVRQDAELVAKVAAHGLGGLLANVPDRSDQILMIRDFIAPIRFFTDGSGYFFVLDDQCICLAHATQPRFVGRDLSNVKDTRGVYIFREMLELHHKGGGFIEYEWAKPKAAGIHLKLGYIAPIPGTDYFIGTGVYFPDPW